MSTQMVQPGAKAEDGIAFLHAAVRMINLSALANPEGVILVIDAHHAPFVHAYQSVEQFIQEGRQFPAAAEANELGVQQRPVEIVAVTGVGSSALGTAAFGWNVSEALRKPVAAIVPGYGLADILSQALGGWFGFGMHDYLRRLSQDWLLRLAPQAASVGRSLAHSYDTEKESFRSGSPESDILHHILREVPEVKRLYGHSKGALCIQNAARSLPTERYLDLHVTTFGCVIAEETNADYNQILGREDALGQMNSWGNWPEKWIRGWHSTNSLLPGTMPVSDLVTQDVRDEDPVIIDPKQIEAAVLAALQRFTVQKQN